MKQLYTSSDAGSGCNSPMPPYLPSDQLEQLHAALDRSARNPDFEEIEIHAALGDPGTSAGRNGICVGLRFERACYHACYQACS